MDVADGLSEFIFMHAILPQERLQALIDNSVEAIDIVDGLTCRQFWLLLHPPPQPIHAVALALEAWHAPCDTPGAADVIQQRNLGRDDAEVVRSLRCQARKFEAVLADARASEPIKAAARRKREEIREFLRKSPWRSPDGTQQCVRAVPASELGSADGPDEVLPPDTGSGGRPL